MRRIEFSAPPAPYGDWFDKICSFTGQMSRDIDRNWLEKPGMWRFSLAVFLLISAEFCLVTGGAFVLWLLRLALSDVARTLRRSKYYPQEKMRRRKFRRMRRKIRIRRTINPCPTADELLKQYAKIRRSPRDMLLFGSMLCDLEAYVDNSLKFNAEGAIIGRNPGIRGWLRENCHELHLRYKSVMRYKRMAEKFRQAVGIRDPIPASVVIEAASESPEKSLQNENRQEACHREREVRPASTSASLPRVRRNPCGGLRVVPDRMKAWAGCENMWRTKSLRYSLAAPPLMLPSANSGGRLIVSAVGGCRQILDECRKSGRHLDMILAKIVG